MKRIREHYDENVLAKKWMQVAIDKFEISMSNLMFTCDTEYYLIREHVTMQMHRTIYDQESVINILSPCKQIRENLLD